LGIDLGTTNSAVGVTDSGFPILLADAEGNRITPSAVFYPPGGGAPVVGGAALRARGLHPGDVVTSAKRLMGRRRGELRPEEAAGFPFVVTGAPDGPVRLRAGGRERAPDEVAADVLRHLKVVAETALETEVHRAVITVPAYFNDAQRNATKRAGERAGLTVERILNEPTAAALAYGLDKLSDQAKVAVYDLGGGTFDVTVLELADGVFHVLSTHGDTWLGGDDIDRDFAAWLAARCGVSPAGADAVRFVEAAAAAKIALSTDDETVVRLPFLEAASHQEIVVSRAAFEEVAAPTVRKTGAHCRQAVAAAGLDFADLDAVVLVGGSTRIPAVRRFVAEVFGRAPDVSQHPDESVALGAVIQAGILSGALRQMVLLDVTPLSLGIETFGGLMNVIIPRNTTIPAKAGELFTNAVANQDSMLVRVLQGEREMADDNWELGKITVPFTPGPKASARVGVQFRIDENGILEVLARDTATGADTVLEIADAAVDVADEEVERIIDASVEHAWADMEGRRLVEQRMKAEELVAAVDLAQAQLGATEVTDEEREAVADAVRAVHEALGAGELAALEAANRALDTLTEPLAAKLVEKALGGGP
jgi:molecular chaperone DnaK